MSSCTTDVKVKQLNNKIKSLQEKVEELQKANIKYKKKLKVQAKTLYSYEKQLSNIKCNLNKQLELNDFLESTCNKASAKLLKTETRINLQIENRKLLNKLRGSRYKTTKLKQDLHAKSIEVRTLKRRLNKLSVDNKILNKYKIKYLQIVSDKNVSTLDTTNVSTSQKSVAIDTLEDVIKNKTLVEQLDIKCEFGIINISNYKITFKSLDGSTYKARNLNNLKIANGIPCKVKIIDNTAILVETYPIDKSKNDTSSKHKYKKVKTNVSLCTLQDYKDLFHGEKVLILSSMKPVIYKVGFNELNLKVDWFDVYEQNINLLKNKLNKYDVIIVCLDRISHKCSRYLDTLSISTDTRIEMLHRSTLNRILSRTYYALQQ